MQPVKIKFKEYQKHRRPQYRNYGNYDIIPQEEEKYLWLRLQVDVESKDFSINFFIQSEVEINIIDNCYHAEAAYKLTFDSFPKYFKLLIAWDIFGLQSFQPLFWVENQEKINEICAEESIKIETESEITDELYSQFIEQNKEINEIKEVYDYVKKYLEQMVSSRNSSGFGYISNEIRLYLRFLSACARSVSKHSHDGCYFKENVRKLERSFEELIKRKQVNNFNYQYQLGEARTALWSLRTPRIWDDRYPNLANWKEIKIS